MSRPQLIAGEVTGRVRLVIRGDLRLTSADPATTSDRPDPPELLLSGTTATLYAYRRSGAAPAGEFSWAVEEETGAGLSWASSGSSIDVVGEAAGAGTIVCTFTPTGAGAPLVRRHRLEVREVLEIVANQAGDPAPGHAIPGEVVTLRARLNEPLEGELAWSVVSGPATIEGSGEEVELTAGTTPGEVLVRCSLTPPPGSEGSGAPAVEHTIAVAEDFSVNLYLTGQSELVPLALDAADFRDSKVRFELQIASSEPGFQADSVQFRVAKPSLTEGETTEVFSETVSGPLTPGSHMWEWDGYGNDSKLSTTELTLNGLQAEAHVTRAGVTRSAVLRLANEHSGTEWVDLYVDDSIALRDVNVSLGMNFQNGGDLPAVPEMFKYFSQVLSGLEVTPDMPAAAFERLRGLARQGIETYWSRTGAHVVNLAAASAQVSVTVVEREHPACPLDLYQVPDPGDGSDVGFIRSHALGAIDASAVCNYGEYATKTWTWTDFEPPPFAPAKTSSSAVVAEWRFAHDCAHELGHEILVRAVDYLHSITHKGSSTLTQQPGSGSGVMPSSGEVDLMWYYTHFSWEKYQLSVAADEDVRKLLSLVSVRFRAAT